MRVGQARPIRLEICAKTKIEILKMSFYHGCLLEKYFKLCLQVHRYTEADVVPNVQSFFREFWFHLEQCSEQNAAKLTVKWSSTDQEILYDRLIRFFRLLFSSSFRRRRILHLDQPRISRLF